MSERNCRTEVELDDETRRLLDALEEAGRTDSTKAEYALSKACDSTLVRVMQQIGKRANSERWPERIQAILEERRIERAAR